MSKVLIGTTIGFIFGSVAGAFAGYFFGKNKFQAQADKEIESVKKHLEDYYSNKGMTNEAGEDSPKERKPIPAPLVDPDKEEYNKYSGMYKGESIPPEGIQPKTTIKGVKPKKEQHKTITPYVITPDQYNDSEYESVQLIWYSDKVLADTDGNVIHNINEVVGPEALSTFGRYLDDTVYVRDDNKKIDYDIAWDARKYSSVVRASGARDINPEEDN